MYDENEIRPTNETNENNEQRENSPLEQGALPIQEDAMHTQNEHHVAAESVININQKKAPKKKGGMAKFVAGLTIVSLVGGTAIGTSFALVSPYVNAKAGNNNTVQSTTEPASSISNSNVQPVTTNNTITDIAKNIGPAVVSIYNTKHVSSGFSFFYEGSGSQVVSGIGSGVIFKEDEDNIYIVTNAHVVEGATSLQVNFLGDKKVDCKLVGQDTVSDIAVVEVPKADIDTDTLNSIKVAPLGDSDQIEVGELAVAIGTPMEAAFNNTVTTGVISATARKVTVSTGNTMTLIQTDAAINPGNSGGPLVGASGQVIGINAVKLVDSSVEGIGFAIPINTAKPIIEDILENGTVVRPGLGITGTDVSNVNSQLYSLPIGVFVSSVTAGGSADTAGIEPYDVIIGFDDTTITTMDQLKSLLNEKKVGDKVTIKVIRNNEQKSFNVTLKEMPQNAASSNSIGGSGVINQ